MASLTEKWLAESLGLAPGDHAAAPGRDGHGAGPSEQLQLDGRALGARDAQRHPPVVDFVVTVVLQQRGRDLRQAQPLLRVHHQRHDRHPVQHHRPDLITHMQISHHSISGAWLVEWIHPAGGHPSSMTSSFIIGSVGFGADLSGFCPVESNRFPDGDWYVPSD